MKTVRADEMETGMILTGVITGLGIARFGRDYLVTATQHPAIERKRMAYQVDGKDTWIWCDTSDQFRAR